MTRSWFEIHGREEFRGWGLSYLAATSKLGPAGIRALGSSTLQGTTVCVAYQLFQAKTRIKMGGKSSSNVIADFDALVLVPELFVPVFQHL